MCVPAEDGVADIVVVRDLAVVEDNHILELDAVTDDTIGTDQCRAADEGAMPDLGIRADDARWDDVGRGEDHGILVDPDLRLNFLVFRTERGTKPENEILDSGQSFPGPLERGKIRGCEGVLEVEQLRNAIHVLPPCQPTSSEMTWRISGILLSMLLARAMRLRARLRFWVSYLALKYLSPVR